MPKMAKQPQSLSASAEEDSNEALLEGPIQRWHCTLCPPTSRPITQPRRHKHQKHFVECTGLPSCDRCRRGEEERGK